MCRCVLSVLIEFKQHKYIMHACCYVKNSEMLLTYTFPKSSLTNGYLRTNFLAKLSHSYFIGFLDLLNNRFTNVRMMSLRVLSVKHRSSMHFSISGLQWSGINISESLSKTAWCRCRRRACWGRSWWHNGGRWTWSGCQWYWWSYYWWSRILI